MMCDPCRNTDCLACTTPSCTHGHAGTPVRALTSQERYDYVMGRHTDIVRPRVTNA